MRQHLTSCRTWQVYGPTLSTDARGVLGTQARLTLLFFLFLLITKLRGCTEIELSVGLHINISARFSQVDGALVTISLYTSCSARW